MRTIIFLILSILLFVNISMAEEVVLNDFKTIQVSELETSMSFINSENSNLLFEKGYISDKPHFLFDVNQIPNPSYEKIIELSKLYQMKKSFYSYNGGLYIDKSVENLGLYRNFNYEQIISNIEILGKKVLIIYPLHLVTSDGIIYMSSNGPKNLAEFSPLYRKYEVQWALNQINDEEWKNIKKSLSWGQFQAVKDFVFQSLEQAVIFNMDKYKELESKVIDLQKSKIGQSVDYLKSIQSSDVSRILSFINVKPEEFIPDILIFGPLPYAWGMANWKTIGSEKVVFYDTLGSVYDYINGKPLILSHELVHSNPYLQGVPTLLYFNVEMWTALTTDLFDELNYFMHPYLSVVMDEVHIYFGYNYKEAIKRIWPNKFVSLRNFNRKEFEENIEKIKEIRKVLEDFVINKFLPEYYSDVYFWNTINRKWCDTSAAWRIMMAFEFEPTIIYDNHKIESGVIVSPAIQTKRWLSEQEAAGKLQKLAKEAMSKTGELTEFGKEMSKIEDYSGNVKCPSDSGFYTMSNEQQESIRNIIRNNSPESLLLLKLTLGDL